LADYPALDLTIWQDEDVLGLLDLVYACLDDFGPLAIHEHENGGGVRVFFRSADVRDVARDGLVEQFGRRLEAIRPVDVPDEGWARRSQAQLTPVRVGRIVVTPPWIADPGDPDTIRIVIEPSMGFGTGHHATTRLCLAALQRISLDRGTVLDVGTGSGVLAIAASRLGAEDVTGIDEDQDAIQSAWDNLSLNPSAQVTLIVGDLRSTELVAADVVVANLTGGLLIQSAERLRKVTNAQGRLILSGFMADEERDVLAAFGAFSVEHRGEEEGWVCVTLK